MQPELGACYRFGQTFLPSPPPTLPVPTNWVFPTCPCTSLPWQVRDARSSLATGIQGGPHLVAQPEKGLGLPLQTHPHAHTQANGWPEVDQKSPGSLGRIQSSGTCGLQSRGSPGESRPWWQEVAVGHTCPSHLPLHPSWAADIEREVTGDHLGEVGPRVDVRHSRRGLSRKEPRNPESDLANSPDWKGNGSARLPGPHSEGTGCRKPCPI